MISYTLINKMAAKSLQCIDYGLVDNENLLNQLLSGRQVLILRDWLNGNTMFYETFVCFYVSEQNPFVSVFVHKYLRVLNDVECTTFKMFVTQMSNYLFVISFQLMF